MQRKRWYWRAISIAQQLRLSQGKRKRLLSADREELLHARMVPIATVFDRFPRLVQQTIASHHKPAELHITGGQVLVDKVIAETLYDPRLHLSRNAYDPRLEPIEMRHERGKLTAG